MPEIESLSTGPALLIRYGKTFVHLIHSWPTPEYDKSERSLPVYWPPMVCLASIDPYGIRHYVHELRHANHRASGDLELVPRTRTCIESIHSLLNDEVRECPTWVLVQTQRTDVRPNIHYFSPSVPVFLLLCSCRINSPVLTFCSRMLTSSGSTFVICHRECAFAESLLTDSRSGSGSRMILFSGLPSICKACCIRCRRGTSMIGVEFMTER
ncbi:uncharacterized protein C8Q71DRAFT_743678 [Rhodofomes roseus]|uniref:Uncharacterized protein n=1 Tax=Rhodofomes roseus TaxID=34475 RepID=A0ABQ8KR85_9APHY|nr:uncharacterized protein C8Q71DRAFT_743678 [Rhodofomes roseus]KAH9841146.1 hypothetical protein C8Q71DRAFT_743678 [Rhodofomes roseus]